MLAQVPGFPPYDEITLVDVVEERETTRLVRHKYGDLEIPTAPQRIVVDHGQLEVLLSLGVTPVAAVVYGDLAPRVASLAQGVEILAMGGDGSVNIEKIAALDPDLLIGSFSFGGYDENVYAQLSKIAPTVVLRELPNWQIVTRDVAALLGMPDKGAQVLADYRAKVAAARQTIAPVIGDGTVAMVQVLPESLYLTGPGTKSTDGRFILAYFGAFLYRDLGLKPSAEVVSLTATEETKPISLELVPQLTADHLFVVATSRPGQTIEEQPTYKSFVESPLFKQLPASLNNHVYMFGPVPENYYTTVETLATLAALVSRAR